MSCVHQVIWSFITSCLSVYLAVDSAQEPPVLTLLPPSSEELTENKATVLCLVNHMSSGFAGVSWLVDGNPVTSGVFTGPAEPRANNKFSLSSYLRIQSSEWENNKEIRCSVSVGGQTAAVSIKTSECAASTWFCFFFTFNPLFQLMHVVVSCRWSCRSRSSMSLVRTRLVPVCNDDWWSWIKCRSENRSVSVGSSSGFSADLHFHTWWCRTEVRMHLLILCLILASCKWWSFSGSSHWCRLTDCTIKSYSFIQPPYKPTYKLKEHTKLLNVRTSSDSETISSWNHTFHQIWDQQHQVSLEESWCSDFPKRRLCSLISMWTCLSLRIHLLTHTHTIISSICKWCGFSFSA